MLTEVEVVWDRESQTGWAAVGSSQTVSTRSRMSPEAKNAGRATRRVCVCSDACPIRGDDIERWERPLERSMAALSSCVCSRSAPIPTERFSDPTALLDCAACESSEQVGGRQSVADDLAQTLRSRWSSRTGRTRFRAKYRALRAYSGWRRNPLASARFLLLDPELNNFTYDIANLDELAGVVSDALGAKQHDIRPLLDEPRGREPFYGELKRRMQANPSSKNTPYFGRRLGWYAVARWLKPGLIVETGIQNGLGSTLLLEALAANVDEGHSGELLSIDVDPDTGWMVSERQQDRWTKVVGSSFDVLEEAIAGRLLSMFIHDSDHSPECERFEMDVAVAHRAERMALISDNSHVTSVLRDICREMGTEFWLFSEHPRRHFYPGAGMGITHLRRSNDC